VSSGIDVGCHGSERVGGVVEREHVRVDGVDGPEPQQQQQQQETTARKPPTGAGPTVKLFHVCMCRPPGRVCWADQGVTHWPAGREGGAPAPLEDGRLARAPLRGAAEEPGVERGIDPGLTRPRHEKGRKAVVLSQFLQFLALASWEFRESALKTDSEERGHPFPCTDPRHRRPARRWRGGFCCLAARGLCLGPSPSSCAGLCGRLSAVCSSVQVFQCQCMFVCCLPLPRMDGSLHRSSS
jgi:hypothetical protein